MEIEGLPLRDLTFDELRRRHVLFMVDHMLRVEGRAIQGVRGILSAFSAMAENAIGDDAAAVNAFAGIRLRRNDPRVRKVPRKVRVWSFEQMRAFARGGCPEVRAATKRPDSKWGRCYPPHDYEALLLTPGLTGLRLGEFLALRRSDFDGTQLALRFSAHEGKLIESSDQKNHERTVPVPPSLAELLEALPERDDTDLLFPTPTGELWRERNFYRSVWVPAQFATGLANPHSDVDFLIVEPEVANEAEESVRLHRTLRDLRLPADVIVVSRDYADRWREVRGGVVHAALSQGRILAG